jgi:Protein of unknown function (DUF3606)
LDASRTPHARGPQEYELRYEAKKTGKLKKAAKRAVKRIGNSRKKVRRALRAER